jgi:hypothetical protein
MPSSSRAPLVLWLPVFAASVAGGWMLGRHAPAERLREKEEASSPAVSVRLAEPVRMAEIAQEDRPLGFWPPGMVHEVWIEGETIAQFHGEGPWMINYVNPADDPRKAKK